MIHDDNETSDKTAPIKAAAPGPASAPRPWPLALVPRRPPPGRPSTSVSLSELIERVARDVRSATAGEVERRQDELRAELAGGIRTATNIGVAAIVMNVVALLALVVARLVSSRVLPAGGVSLAVAVLTAVTALATLSTMIFGAAKAGLRRPQSAR